MILFKKAGDISKFLAEKKRTGLLPGFVPTMGALHQGHISLVSKAKEKGGPCVCSIFVNPTQFNDSKDFEKYPSTIEADIDMLEKAGCDVLFLPSVNEMYPGGIKNLQHYELGYLETILEGSFRPGHFQGVCQVVDRLFKIVQPSYLYLGQKDYQQCMVIKKLAGLTNAGTEIVVCPTLREPTGLAMSSRNMRLNEEERKKAVKIFETLSFIKKEIGPGDLLPLKQKAVEFLLAGGFRVDYIEIADATTLQLMDKWDGSTQLVALAAAFLNEVRLIDNIILNEE